MTGVSNDDPLLKDMMKKFKIYASKIEYQDDENSPKNYTIDHTVLSYLMNWDGEYLDHLASSLNARDLSDRV